MEIEPGQKNSNVATIGFFDGVHIGHRYLIEQVKKEACKRSFRSMLVTFCKHPRQVMQSEYQPQLLSTLDEKCRLLEATGVDSCTVLEFTPEMAAMTAYEFMRDVLQEMLGVAVLVVGYDHRFGKGRAEGFEEYCHYGRQLGMEVVLANAFLHHEIEVSSSVIRALLSDGEVMLAADCLGREYSVQGRVVNGYRIGHELGFPTANIELLDRHKMLPKYGAYVVQVFFDDRVYGGMLNIGMRPTIANDDNHSVEVHLFDFNEDLYGCTLRVSFVARLRDERKFRTRNELMQQLEVDERNARSILESKSKKQ